MDQKKLHILSLLAALTAATIFGMSFMFSKMALVTAAPQCCWPSGSRWRWRPCRWSSR